MKRCLFGLALLSVCSIPAYSAPADDSKRKEAEAVLDRAIKECGGADRLAKLQVVFETTYSELHDGKVFASDFYNISWQRPGRFRTDRQPKPRVTAILSFVTDGDEVWTLVNGKVFEESREAKAASFTQDRCLAFGAELITLKGVDYALTPLGKVKVGDQEAVAVKVTREGYVEQTLYFDKDTGLLIKRCLKFPPRVAGRATFDVEIRFEEYKEVEKIKYASKARVVYRGNELEFVVDKFKPVEKIDDELFKKPE